MTVPAYAPPTVTAAGLVLPSYQSILADNLNAYLNIYGQTQVVDPSTAIYQLLSIVSLKQSDTCQALQLAYNQSSPQTAVGAGLDRVVKMNGLARDPYSYSTVLLTCTGTNGFTLTNCIAQDQNGNLWALPISVTLTGGSVTVTATCTTPGAIAAEAGTVNIIATPTGGWASVTNPSDAVPGTPVEADSGLRARQSVSVALPSLTPVASTVAAILATPGVTRIAPGYPTPGGPGTSIENPTGAVDSWGNPAHSVSMCVEGGTDLAVATTVYTKKTIGCYTNGTTAVLVTDATTGYQETIRFYRPAYTPVFVLCTVRGYGTTPTSAVLTSVQTALVAYLNALSIGETVSNSALVYEAMAVNAAVAAPTFGVQSMSLGTLTAATTASTTSGSAAIVVASATGIVSGQLVVGVGIPVGTTVAGTPVGTTVTLSANATATASGVAVQFSTLAAADLAMVNYYYVAQGAAADVLVVTI